MPARELIWAAGGLIALVLIGLALRAEKRRFAARGQAGAWLWVRLASLPAALLAAGAVYLLARAISGPEALAALYLSMFTLGPLVYFGLLWLAGRVATPTLSARDSAAIGGSGLLMALALALTASMAAPWVHRLDGAAQQAQRDRAVERALPHRIQHRQRWRLPDIGEVLSEHWQAPPGIRVERIEWEVGGQYLQTGDSSGSVICQEGEDVHVFRPAAAPPPHWRMVWRDAADVLHRSDWTGSAADAANPPVDLVPTWTADGFTLPVRIPHALVIVERRWASGRVLQSGALDGQAPPSPKKTCLPLAFSHGDGDSVVSGVVIRLWLSAAQRMGLAAYTRPAE